MYVVIFMLLYSPAKRIKILKALKMILITLEMKTTVGLTVFNRSVSLRQQAVPAALVLWYAHACFRAIVLVMFLSAILVVLKTAVEVLSL